VQRCGRGGSWLRNTGTSWLAIFSHADSRDYLHRAQGVPLGGTIYDHLGLIYATGVVVNRVSLVARLYCGSRCAMCHSDGEPAGTRAMMVATGIPLAVGFVAYGIAWSSALRTFMRLVPPTHSRGMHLAVPGHPFLKYLLLWLT